VAQTYYPLFESKLSLPLELPLKIALMLALVISVNVAESAFTNSGESTLAAYNKWPTGIDSIGRSSAFLCPR
jgi:hypothetical protein